MTLDDLTDDQLIALANEMSPAPRPIAYYPGWRFCIEEMTKPDDALLSRLAIWSEFKRREIDAQIKIEVAPGVKFSVTLGNDLSRCLYVSGSYDPNEIAFLSHYLRPGMIAVDAGANEGFYTTFIASKVTHYGKVLAFEPSEREYRRLCDNIAGVPWVIPFPFGLGAETGEATLHVAESEHAGQNTIGGFCYSIKEDAKETISLRKLDDVLSEQQISRLDFIKIDVEGAELSVLLGADTSIRAFKPTILLEISEGSLALMGTSQTELLSHLSQLGYHIYDFSSESGGLVLIEHGQDCNGRNVVASIHRMD